MKYNKIIYAFLALSLFAFLYSILSLSQAEKSLESARIEYQDNKKAMLHNYEGFQSLSQENLVIIIPMIYEGYCNPDVGEVTRIEHKPSGGRGETTIYALYSGDKLVGKMSISENGDPSSNRVNCTP